MRVQLPLEPLAKGVTENIIYVDVELKRFLIDQKLSEDLLHMGGKQL